MLRKHDRSKQSQKVTPVRKTDRRNERRQAATNGPISGPEQVTQPDSELLIYDRAIELFNAGQFQGAKELFIKLVVASNSDLAHTAGLRVRMCDQRLTALGA